MMLRLPLPAAAVLRWRYLAVLVLVSGLLLPAWYGTSHSSPNRASGQDAGRLRFDFDVAREVEADAQEQPEAYLQRIQFLLEASQYAQALEHAEKLVTAYPTFQLGNLLYADLLNLSTQAPETDPLGAIEAKNKPAIVQGLKKELDTRLRALRSPYPANTIPKGLGFLAPSTEHFAVVDASASRMYVFRNTPSPTAPVQLELLHHFYVSVGQNGIRKQQEGDGRTPLGVYFTQKALADKRLPDLYGAGALTLNYPNLYDVHQGRTGSGIWVHGTPSAQYSRLPEASDGCLVLSNDTMRLLLALSPSKGIPVFIQERIEWVPRTQAFELPEALRQLVDDKFPAARSARADAAAPGPRRLGSGVAHLLSWRDQDRTVVLLDLLATERGPLRTYWVHKEGAWALVAETAM